MNHRGVTWKAEYVGNERIVEKATTGTDGETVTEVECSTGEFQILPDLKLEDEVKGTEHVLPFPRKAQR